MAEIGDTNVRVTVNGTTFSGMYEVVGPTVELTSADFGEHVAGIGNHDPYRLAQQVLREMAQQAIAGGVPFLRDDGTMEPPAETPPG